MKASSLSSLRARGWLDGCCWEPRGAILMRPLYAMSVVLSCCVLANVLVVAKLVSG
jgi:hypothetical protein